MGGNNNPWGRKGKPKNQAKSSETRAVLVEDPFETFMKFKEKFNQLSEQDQYLFLAKNKIPFTAIKYRNEHVKAKRVEFAEKSNEEYLTNISMFKSKYLKKQTVYFQEAIIKKIDKILRPWVYYSDWKARHVRAPIILVLVPKRHGKTEGIVQPLLAHHITFYKNESHKYASEASKLAKQKIFAIKEAFEKDWDLINDFGPFRTAHWSSDRFIVQRSKLSPDPTLEAWGLDMKFVGANTDFLVIDDPMNADMFKGDSEVPLNVHNRIFGELLNTRNPTAPTIIIMTRKHYEDLVACFVEDSCPYCAHGHKAKIFIIDEFRKAIVKGDYKNPGPNTYELIRDEHGNIMDFIMHSEFQALWPERFTVKDLLGLYWQLGDLAFDRDYQNDPSLMEGNTFKMLYLKGDGTDNYPGCFFNPTHFNFLTDDYIRYSGLDSSFGGPDYGGYIELAHDPISNDVYVARAERLVDDIDGQAMYAIERAGKWHPRRIITEAIASAHVQLKKYKRVEPRIYLENDIREGKNPRIAAGLLAPFKNGKIKILSRL